MNKLAKLFLTGCVAVICLLGWQLKARQPGGESSPSVKAPRAPVPGKRVIRERSEQTVPVRVNPAKRRGLLI